MVEWNDNTKPVCFELFNAQGKKVLSTGFLRSMTIDVEHLPDGVYIYRLSADNQVRKGSLIKK